MSNNKRLPDWFVRKWYYTVRTYMGNQRDVNTSFETEAEARAFYDQPWDKLQNEAVLFHWVDVGTPNQRYVQVARKKKPKASAPLAKAGAA